VLSAIAERTMGKESPCMKGENKQKSLEGNRRGRENRGGSFVTEDPSKLGEKEKRERTGKVD